MAGIAYKNELRSDIEKN